MARRRNLRFILLSGGAMILLIALPKVIRYLRGHLAPGEREAVPLESYLAIVAVVGVLTGVRLYLKLRPRRGRRRRWRT